MTKRARLRRFFEKFLPHEWVLRSHLGRIDRAFWPRIKQAKGDEREYLAHEHAYETAYAEEEFEEIRTKRLRRLARRYYATMPPMPTPKEMADDEGNEHWTRGPMTQAWYLTDAGVAFMQRQIEEAKARRRQKWETWAKILGGLISGLVALGSVIVSLILASRR